MTHRLEAFSDIVIGFSLAQASVNFVIPPHAVDVYAHPIGLLAFLATFAIVAGIWYSHHWLFDRLFVPTGTTIVVNFATLASVVWLAYQFQLYLHFAPTPDARVATISYLFTFSAAWVLLALLYGICLRQRWNALPEADRKAALFKTGRIGTIAVAAAVATLSIWQLHQRLEIVIWIILGAAIVYRIAARFGGLRES